MLHSEPPMCKNITFHRSPVAQIIKQKQRQTGERTTVSEARCSGEPFEAAAGRRRGSGDATAAAQRRWDGRRRGVASVREKRAWRRSRDAIGGGDAGGVVEISV